MSSTLTVTNLTATNLTDGAGTTSTFANVASGSAKAWCHFSQATPAIKDSLNISSLTDTSTGRGDVNFTSAMDTINYGFVTGTDYVSTSNVYVVSLSDDGFAVPANIRTVSKFYFTVTYWGHGSSGAFNDASYNSLSFNGDLA